MPEEQAKTYQRLKLRLFFVEQGLDVILVAGFLLSGLSAGLSIWAHEVASSAFIVRLIYISVFCACVYPFHLPLDFMSGYWWEHRFHLSRQSLGAWALDQAKSALLGWLFIVVIFEAVYALMATYPSGWWIAAAGFWLLITLFIARILPQVIIPLFYKYVPVKDQELRQRIFRLFASCKVGLKDIYAINMSKKTKKANAFVCGLGNKRRVVFSDTLLQNFTPDEIEAVVAHELGHYCRRDIIKLIAVSTSVVLCGFFLVDALLRTSMSFWNIQRLEDLVLFPIFVLGMLVFNFVTTPAVYAFSRHLEKQADLFSLRMTGKPEEFISMMNKLSDMNMSDKNPGRLREIMFYDHPPIGKRIALAQEFITS